MIDFGEHVPQRKYFDLTPMIDVVFLLLIFFMLTSIYAQQGLPVALPEAETAKGLPKKTITVVVQQNGAFLVEGRAVASELLRSELSGLMAATAAEAVAVASDKGVPFGKVVEVLDNARSAGARNISVVAERR